MITGISDTLGTRASLSAAILVFMMISGASAQRGFHAPDQAVNALVGAVRIGNRAEMLTILGREAIEIVSSGRRSAASEICRGL